MKRSTTALLTAIAVLLAANLAVSLTGEAEAQQETGGVFIPVVRVVGVAAYNDPSDTEAVVYRVWSDGTVEQNFQNQSICGANNWCGWSVIPE